MSLPRIVTEVLEYLKPIEPKQDKDLDLEPVRNRCKCGSLIAEGESICFRCEDYDNHIGE